MSTSTPKLIRSMALVCALIIVLMPFHAFLSIWTSSLFGHYTLVRLWKELLLALLYVCAAVVIAGNAYARKQLVRDRLTQVILAYVVLLIIVAVIALATDAVTPKAAAYGLLLDIRFLLSFLVTWTVSLQTDLLVRAWRRLLLIPAAVVVGLATLQYTLLPADFLRHFGYSPATIDPVATVDQKASYQRIFSTLRGPNPFGAYLVVVLAAAASILMYVRKRRLLTSLFFIAAGLALFFSFSRSAYIGAFIALLWLVWAAVRSRRARKLLVVSGGILVLLAAGVGYGLRDNDRFQNVFFHTDEDSQSAESSNTGHLNAVRQGIGDIVSQPLGGGVGSAGPASAYNDQPARIAENYYVQIGQEAGVLGLALFVAISVLVVRRLYGLRDVQLAQVLLASFIGLTAINMLSHAWADDTLAYLWWGLAGAVIGNVHYKQSNAKTDGQ